MTVGQMQKAQAGHAADFSSQYQPMAAANMDSGRSAIMALARVAVIDAETIGNLRRFGMTEAGISREEADALFALESAANAKAPAWDDLFIDTITRHCVWDLRPTGVVNEAQAEWLIQAADAARTPNAFAVLVNVLDEAHRVPQWFTAAVKARALRGWPGADLARAAAISQAQLASA